MSRRSFRCLTGRAAAPRGDDVRKARVEGACPGHICRATVRATRHDPPLSSLSTTADGRCREAAMTASTAPSPPRLFYGWLVVAAAFAVTFVGFGSAYTFSAFVGSLQKDFAASRGSVSLVFSLAGFLYFGLGIVSGPLADRWGSRRVAFIGMILTGVGLAVASTARSLAEVYTAYGLGVGLGVGCSYVPAVGAVQRWFVRRRGFASGLAVSGIGVGTLVMPPLASLLIDALGWRSAYLALGALAIVIGAGMALLIENDPRDRGLSPDGEGAA